MKKRLTYKSSGVDIKKANTFVSAIGQMTKSAASKSVIKKKGAFGSLFAFDAKKYRNPILVSSSDGVGTKLMIANFKLTNTQLVTIRSFFRVNMLRSNSSIRITELLSY